MKSFNDITLIWNMIYNPLNNFIEWFVIDDKHWSFTFNFSLIINIEKDTRPMRLKHLWSNLLIYVL